MKKILMISHSSRGGGAEIIFLKTADALKKNTLKIIFNSKEGFTVKKAETKKFDIEIINNFILNTSVVKVIVRFIFWNSVSIFKLMKIIQKEKFDYIYSGSIVNYIGGIAAILTRKKHVWHIHEMDNVGYQWFNPKFNFLVRYIFKYSTVIFVSDGVKNSWLKRLSLKESDLEYEIIYNPIKKLNKKKDYFNAKNKKITIGCAGGFCKNKNQKFLIETFIELQKKYDNIFLKLAGDEVVNEGKRLIENKISKKKYSLYDYTDISIFFSKIDILVVPSYSEAWPLVAIEAASFGLIPVLTTEGSINELLKESENAFYINPYNSTELYEVLENIIINYDRLKSSISNNNKKLLEKCEFNKKFEKRINSIF